MTAVGITLATRNKINMEVIESKWYTLSPQHYNLTLFISS